MSMTSIPIHETNARRPTDTKPWYRQFWPWIIIGLPAASVVLSFVTLYFALEGADAVVPHEGDSASYSAPREPAEHRTP